MVIEKVIGRDSHGQEMVGIYVAKNGVELFPGNNIVPDVKGAELKKDPTFKALVEKGVLKITVDIDKNNETMGPEVNPTGNTELDAVAQLAQMNAADAIKVIPGIENILVLQEIVAKETRVTVKTAAEKAIADMKKKDAEEYEGSVEGKK